MRLLFPVLPFVAFALISCKQPVSHGMSRTAKKFINRPPEFVWEKTYGGKLNESADAVINTPDGGYLIGSTSRSPQSGEKTEPNKGISDYWVIKLDSVGNKQWDRTLGGIKVSGEMSLGGASDEELSCLLATPDGGYLVGGISISNKSGDKSTDSKGSADIWIVKVDANGHFLWDRSYGGNGVESLGTMLLTADGNFLLVGSTTSSKSGDLGRSNLGRKPTHDGWIIKINPTGSILWEKTYGGYQTDMFKTALLAPDGGFYLGGSSDSPTSEPITQNCCGDSEFWLVRVDSEGKQLWEKTFGGSERDELLSISFSSHDNSILLGGNTDSPKSRQKTSEGLGLFDYWVINITRDGEKQWERSFGGSHMDDFCSLYSLPDGGWVITGSSRSMKTGSKTHNPTGGIFMDYWLVGLDANGNQLWDRQWGGKETEIMYASASKKPGTYILLGEFMAPGRLHDLWTVLVSIPK